MMDETEFTAPALNVFMESVTATPGPNAHPRFVPGQSRDRSGLVKYATAPPSRGRLPVTRKGRVKASSHAIIRWINQAPERLGYLLTNCL
jgi:hypothetical protein